MTTQVANLTIKDAANYGAIEIKEFIKKHTWRAFIYTIILLIFMLLGYYIPKLIIGSDSETTGIKKKPPLQKVVEPVTVMVGILEVPVKLYGADVAEHPLTSLIVTE